jgi:hypothetical protein
MSGRMSVTGRYLKQLSVNSKRSFKQEGACISCVLYTAQFFCLCSRP